MHRTFSARVGICAVALLLCAASLALAADSSQQVELRWALAALDSSGENLEAVHKDSRLEPGTRLKFLVEPLSSAATYLILLDSQNEVHLLYKGSAAELSEPQYVPAGRHWLELDDRPGQETFFLVASADPLEELDLLLTKNISASDTEAQIKHGKAVVAEIRRLQKANREFAQPVEKPVMIGGRTRSAPTSEAAIDQIAVEVSAERFFGKTITIDH
jgi:hypothetical protein